MAMAQEVMEGMEFGMDEQRAAMVALLRELASEILAVSPMDVQEESRFREDLGADSLDLVELITAIEDRLQVRLPPGQLTDIRTVGQALDALEALPRDSSRQQAKGES
jgi:acyl carrier protein